MIFFICLLQCPTVEQHFKKLCKRFILLYICLFYEVMFYRSMITKLMEQGAISVSILQYCVFLIKLDKVPCIGLLG